jgi:hypothetical protein
MFCLPKQQENRSKYRKALTENTHTYVHIQVALDLRRFNLRRFRISPILKPGGQKVKKIYFTIIYNVLQFFTYCFLY